MKKNVKYAILVMAAGILMGLLWGAKEKSVLEENRIARNTYGEGAREVEMEVRGDMFETRITCTVDERQYSVAEIEEMWPLFVEELEKSVIGENVSAEEITGGLYYADMLEGYPFELTYQSEPAGILGRDGRREAVLEQEEIVGITVTAEYGEMCYVHSFFVKLLPESIETQEAWRTHIEEEMQLLQQKSVTSSFFTLPQEDDGEVLHWSEPKEYKGWLILLCSSVVSIIFLFSDRFQKKEDEKKRREEITDSYPAFALRYAMLVSAGLTLRQAMQRIAGGERAAGKALYQEIARGMNELETGVSEGMVYENIGKRCDTTQMRKFGTLLASNLRKGQDGLGKLLREEAMNAMAERRETIRKKGETAGTKLLFPMLLLLLIVFVVIMVPAFSSFTIS